MESKRIFKNAAFALLIVGLFTSAASAALIPLTLDDSPDLFSSGIDVVYSGGTLTATGWTTQMDHDGDGDYTAITENTSWGSFSLSAAIDGSGALSSGSVTLDGEIAGLGYTSGTLLTGTLTDFGFDETGGEILEFVFTVTGGDAAGLYGSGPVGMIMNSTGFDGSWGDGFDNYNEDWGGGPMTGNAQSSTAPIPEPATLVLLASGAAAMLLKRRKR